MIMKMKKLTSVLISVLLIFSLTACGGGGQKGGTAKAVDFTYADIELGKDYTDITATVKFLTHRTDMMDPDYNGTTLPEYIAEFNKMYPNITIDVEAMTNYDDDALLRLQGSDWGDIMMIPSLDKDQLPTYFLPFGTTEEMSQQVRFANAWSYDGMCYGVSTTGNAQGIVYNKKVFEQAGITELPKTPDEFIADLKLIKEKTDAIPLYTNYAAGWTMTAWDAYITGSVGDPAYFNQTFLHTKDPFADPGDGTGPYNVYKILYEATANGLIEDDYTTTDWEGCKGMINRGEIGCMVLGSWAYTQMQDGGPYPEDIGYMPFPISINGKQYATAGGDYNFAINANSSEDKQKAAMVFIKWFTEESGFTYNEGGIPVSLKIDEYPEVYQAFDENNVEFVAEEPALPGEETLLNELNADSELMVNNGGADKVQRIVEAAFNGTETYDEIIADWNQRWTDAQNANNVEIQ